jgi:ribosomal protein S16
MLRRCDRLRLVFSLHKQLGTYDPIASAKDGVKEVRLKFDRIKYWLSVGAQPSEPFAKLLSNVGFLPAPPIRYRTISAVPKDQRKYSTVAGSIMRGSGLGLFQATLGMPSSSLSPAFLRAVV